mgnify:CR=1 FL=1
MKKKKETEYFNDAIRLNHLSSYREFRNNVIDKNYSNISKVTNINLKSLQRSTEFFDIRFNLINFLKLKKNKLSLFLFPYEWSNNLHVSIFVKIVSHFLFSFFVLKLSIRRILRVFKITLKPYKHNDFQNKDTVYLFSIPNHTIDILKSGNEYTLIGWLKNNLFHKNTTYFHDNKNLPNIKKKLHFNSFLPKIKIIKKIKVILVFIPYFLISLTKLFFGKWRDLYLADDHLLKEFFINSNQDFLKSYIFPYIGSHFCPSWTNVVMEKGAKVYLLNYSSSSEPNLDGQSKDSTLFRISSWQNIIPFNKDFVPTLKKSIYYPSNILKTPTIFFTHDGSMIEKFVKKDFVAIFDITPFNPEFYIGFSNVASYMYHSHEDKILFYKSFFNDILNISKEFGLEVVLKQKRYNPKQLSAYNELILELQKTKNLIILPPTMSPYYVVDNSFASIAQPFTSVGFYNETKKNVAFYDPLEILTPKHQESKRTNLLIGKKKLTLWLKKLKV